MKPVRPPRLRRGDVIGLVAPSSPPLSRARIEAGVRYLEGLGYGVALGRHVDSRHGFFAGTDAERAADLNAMLRDPRIRAIIALRGGYGTPRLLPAIDYAALRRQPKILVGYSDFTALQLAVFRRTGLVTFSGPMAAVEFAAGPDPFTEEHFWRQLTSTRRVGLLPSPDGEPWITRQAGRGEGPLLGGNLALLVSTLGTPYCPNLRGALLVLEDIHESLHRVDRMFTQLRNAGILSRLSGLALGQFDDCHPSRPGDPHLTLPEVFAHAATTVPGPVIDHVTYGHRPRRLTLPWGLPARLDTRRNRFEVLDSAVV